MITLHYFQMQRCNLREMNSWTLNMRVRFTFPSQLLTLISKHLWDIPSLNFPGRNIIWHTGKVADWQWSSLISSLRRKVGGWFPSTYFRSRGNNLTCPGQSRLSNPPMWFLNAWWVLAFLIFFFKKKTTALSFSLVFTSKPPLPPPRCSQAWRKLAAFQALAAQILPHTDPPTFS